MTLIRFLKDLSISLFTPIPHFLSMRVRKRQKNCRVFCQSWLHTLYNGLAHFPPKNAFQMEHSTDLKGLLRTFQQSKLYYDLMFDLKDMYILNFKGKMLKHPTVHACAHITLDHFLTLPSFSPSLIPPLPLLSLTGGFCSMRMWVLRQLLGKIKYRGPAVTWPPPLSHCYAIHTLHSFRVLRGTASLCVQTHCQLLRASILTIYKQTLKTLLWWQETWSDFLQ